MEGEQREGQEGMMQMASGGDRGALGHVMGMERTQRAPGLCHWAEVMQGLTGNCQQAMGS